MASWYRVEELAPGVYAVVDVDGGWFRSNSGIIDMGGYTLLVDTQYNEPRARQLASIITRDLGLPEPLIVVNTHHHGDHTFGNHVFKAPKAMHRHAASMVEALAPHTPGIYKAFFPHLDFTGSRYTRPEIVVGDEGLILQGGRGGVKVSYEGPAHTLGDMVVWVEWAQVAFIGDLVFNGVTPLAIDGSVQAWLRSLESLRERLGGWTIVGGHGPPAGLDVVDILIKYFRHVLGATGYLRREGLRDPLEIALKATPGPLAGWRGEERLVLNVARAIMDLEGRPPGEPIADLPGLASKMAEYRRRVGA